MELEILLASIALGAMPVSAIAQGTPPVSQVCLEYGEIYSWNALDNRTLIVEDNWHHKFKVLLLTTCPSLQFKERVGFRSPGAMRLTCLSRGDDVVVSNFATGLQRCPIRSVEPYTPAMQKADEAAAAAANAQARD